MGYLRVYIGEKLTKQFELTSDDLTIGRSDENGLVLRDPGVSRHHATIVREGTVYFIVDNNSKNGVFVNKERVERAQLNFWDEIQIFNHVLKFMAVPRQNVEDEEEVPDSETNTIVDKTVFVSVSDASQLDKLRKQKKMASLVEMRADGSEFRHHIKTVNCSFGRSKSCDIRLPGWFTPGLVGRIERSGGSYTLAPGKRGKLLLNGEQLVEPKEVQDGDSIKVRKINLQFQNRLTEE